MIALWILLAYLVLGAIAASLMRWNVERGCPPRIVVGFFVMLTLTLVPSLLMHRKWPWQLTMWVTK